MKQKQMPDSIGEQNTIGGGEQKIERREVDKERMKNNIKNFFGQYFIAPWDSRDKFREMLEDVDDNNYGFDITSYDDKVVKVIKSGNYDIKFMELNNRTDIPNAWIKIVSPEIEDSMMDIHFTGSLFRKLAGWEDNEIELSLLEESKK